jgi:hypothetical protein
MTILGIKTALLKHFSANDIFDPVKHSLTLVNDKGTEDHVDKMLGVALDQLEEIGLVKKLGGAADNPSGATVWVLVLPLELVPQPVYLERDLAGVVADVINHYNEMEEIEVECDPGKIDAADIARLINIIQNWEDEMEDEPPEKGGGSLKDYKSGIN